MTVEALGREIARAIGRAPSIVHVPPPLSLMPMRLVGWLVGEVILPGRSLMG